jgi:hypothetical protein
MTLDFVAADLVARKAQVLMCSAERVPLQATFACWQSGKVC